MVLGSALLVVMSNFLEEGEVVLPLTLYHRDTCPGVAQHPRNMCKSDVSIFKYLVCE